MTLTPAPPTSTDLDPQRPARQRGLRRHGNRRPDARRPSARWFVLLFFAVLAVYGTSPVVTNGDSFLVVPSAHSLLTQGDLEISEHLGAGTDGGIAYVDGSDGGRAVNGVELPRDLDAGEQVYDYFPWVTAVIAVPLVALFEVPGLLGVDGLDVDGLLARGETGLLNLAGGSFLTAGSIVVLALMAWTLLRLPERRRLQAAVLVGVVAALATPAWSTLSRALWSQTTAVLFLSLMCLLAARFVACRRDGGSLPTREVALFAACGALAVAARPMSAVPVAVLAVWLLATERRRVLPFALGGGVVGAGWLAVNLLAYGRLVPPYFDGDRARLDGGLFQAAAEHLVSPNRGLLMFSPVVLLSIAGLVLAVRRRGPLTPALAIAAAVAVVGHVLAVAGSGISSGASYGPRYMADLVPFLVLLALPVVERLAAGRAPRWVGASAAVLVVLSIALHAPGAWSKPAQCWNATPTNIDLDRDRVWDWSDPQALRGVRVLAETGSVKAAVFQRCDDALIEREDAGS